MMTAEEADKVLVETLTRAGKSPCLKCGKVIDRGDVAWNNGDTEAGTPYTWVNIQCQRCDTEIVNFNSWWPEADSFEDLVEHVLDDMPERKR